MQFTAGILYGGKSRRMGQPKAALLLEGRTFLETLRAAFASVPTLLSGAEHIRDVYPDCGPLGGLHALLRKCGTEVLFVTACDTPLVDIPLAEALCALLTEEYDAVVPTDPDGRLHPLCAIYRKGCAAAAESQLQNDQRRMRDFLALLRVRYVPVDELPDAAYKLQNLNTPEEYAQFLETLG